MAKDDYDGMDVRTCRGCGQLTDERCKFCDNEFKEWKWDSTEGKIEFRGVALCDDCDTCEKCVEEPDRLRSELDEGQSFCIRFPECFNISADDLGMGPECQECYQSH